VGDPILSILIPNYNNGRASSTSGDRDFIDDLLRSLAQTLRDDPTPLEIIVADDGSTDDSLDTCRRWSGRTWRELGSRRDGPFCRLLEFAHVGVLSVIANRLTAEARGSICCRLDGDVVVNTPGWAERIVRHFATGPPDLGAIGPKQLGLNGRIHSAGMMILHPRGHHHVAHGAPPHGVTRSIEVDHVMGCFYCHRTEMWAELGGYDEDFLRGQTVDLGLRARLAGWRAFSVPDVEFVHAHAARGRRETEADEPAGIDRSRATFLEKWGFDRLAPDLDVVRERYAGTALLWNAAVFGPRQDPVEAAAAPDLATSDWSRYGADERFRSLVDLRVALVQRMGEQLGPSGRLLVIGFRDGLLCRLLARLGHEVIGVDRDARRVELASAVCARDGQNPATGSGAGPRFVHQDDPRRLPLPAHAVDSVLVADVLETHPNPAGLFAELHRVTAPGATLAVVAAQRPAPHAPDGYAAHGYRYHELLLQIVHARAFRPLPLTGFPDVPDVVVALGRRVDDDAPPAGEATARRRARIERAIDHAALAGASA
jgi:glycosyltransferase involved in cell wall biosynthesis